MPCIGNTEEVASSSRSDGLVAIRREVFGLVFRLPITLPVIWYECVPFTTQAREDRLGDPSESGSHSLLPAVRPCYAVNKVLSITAAMFLSLLILEPFDPRGITFHFLRCCDALDKVL
jgi:hypothetical protein